MLLSPRTTTTKKKVERAERFCVAYEYSKATATLGEAEGELTAMRDTINAHSAKASDLVSLIKRKDDEVRLFSLLNTVARAFL